VVLTTTRSSLSLSTVLLIYLLAVVALTVLGGGAVGLLAATASALCANYYFTEPVHTFRVRGRDEVVALVVYAGVAVAVSGLVEISARRRAATARALTEARALERIAQTPLSQTAVVDVLREIRRTFGFAAVALVDATGSDLARVDSRPGVDAASGAGDVVDVVVDAAPGMSVVGTGPPVLGQDRRLLATMAAAAARARDTELLAAQAGQARELVEIDRVRSALLTAVGHDLRTPLAGIKAATSSLRQPDITWTAQQQAELLATIEESTDELTALVDNLLDMSRLQAGALSVDLRPAQLDAVVAEALLGDLGRHVRVHVPDDLVVLADPGLLQRVVANLVANAIRFSPAGAPATVTAYRDDGSVVLQVVDRGPGVPESDRERIFAPFQRLGDKPRGAGLGLGLAIARGFVEAMSGTVTADATAVGGLTMTVTLPSPP
jgi:two-component system sensor histidine kinase KdpD